MEAFGRLSPSVGQETLTSYEKHLQGVRMGSKPIGQLQKCPPLFNKEMGLSLLSLAFEFSHLTPHFMLLKAQPFWAQNFM